MVNSNKLWINVTYILFLFILTLLFFKNNAINKLFYNKTLFIILFIALLIMLVVLLFNTSKRTLVLRKNLGSISQPLLIPIMLSPLFKCSFKVPYLFCSVCPTKCPFGYMQGTILSSSVLMNIESRNWCLNVCPLGKLQDSLTIIGQNSKLKQMNLTKHKRIQKTLNIIGYSFLAFFLFVFFAILTSPEKFTIIINLFQTPSYSIKLGSLVILAIILFSVFIPRLWCNYICPVGIIWRITKIIAKFKRTKQK